MSEEISNERKQLAGYLGYYAEGVVMEWMRMIEVDEDVLSPGSGALRARVDWSPDDTFTLDKGLGRFRLIVKVEPLPALPPIGPENDPAQIWEQKRITEYGYCIECCEPNEDPSPWCDCRSDEPPCKPPCRQRAHTIENCPSRTEWVASIFLHIEKGDVLRIGQEEATVLELSKLNWHADNSNRYHPRAWEHVELRADLGFGMSPFPTSTAVEILCTSERKAQLIMSEAGLKPRYVNAEDE